MNINFQKIRMKNVRCHTDFELEFKNGSLTAVVGPNGSGKSSIMLSLMMGLFGDSGESKVKLQTWLIRKRKKNLRH